MITVDSLDLMILFLVFFMLGMALHWLEIALSGYHFALRVQTFLGRKFFSCFQIIIYYRGFFSFIIILIGWLYNMPPLDLGKFVCSYFLVTILLPFDQIITKVKQIFFNQKSKFIKKKSNKASNPIQITNTYSISLSGNVNTSLDIIDSQLEQIHNKLLVNPPPFVSIPKISQNTIVCPNCHSSTIPSTTKQLHIYCDSCGVLLTR